MPLPDFDPNTGNLPGGAVHDVTLDEIEERLGGSFRRRALIAELRSVVAGLRAHGVSDIVIAGSFVSTKERPRDVDVVYKPPPGANPDTWGILAPGSRHELKRTRRVDLWRHPSPQPVPGNPFRTQSIDEFFSTDRNGEPRGLVRVIEPENGVEDDDQDGSPSSS